MDRTNRFPAKAGTHSSTGSGAEEWIPAFAGKRLMGRDRKFASDIPAAQSAPVPLKLLLRIGLFRRVGVGEGRERHAAVVNPRDPWIGRELAIEGLGRCHLRHQRD